MIDRVQLVAITISLGLLILVIELVRRRRLVEEYAFVWIAGAVVLLAVSIWRELLHFAARELGVFYPPSVLLLVFVTMVFVALLWFSVILSRQRQQIEHLIEEAAVLAAEVRDLRARTEAADSVVARPTHHGHESRPH